MHIINSLSRKLKVSIYHIEGKNKYGEKLIIYHIGRKIIPDYFFKKFYLQMPKINVENEIYFWQLRKIKSLEQKAHLLFIKTHKFLKFFFRNDFIIMPEYIRQTLDIDKNEENIRKYFHKSLLNTGLRKIAKYKYTYEFSNNPSDIEFFYNRMLIPFVKKRHKIYAHIHSLEEVKKLSSLGILFIKKDNKYVAGATLQKKDTTLVIRRIGVVDGDEVLFREAVIAAIFYSLIKFAKENSYQKVDFGFTVPILSDGVLLYKNKWGMKIEYKPFDSSIFMLKICQLNESLKRILIDSPLITISNNKLGAYIFSDRTPSATKIIGTNITITQDYFRGLEYIRVRDLN